MSLEGSRKSSPEARGISCERGKFFVAAEPGDARLVKELMEYICKPESEGEICPPDCQARRFIEGKLKK